MKRAILVVAIFLGAACGGQNQPRVITAEEALDALPVEAQAQLSVPEWTENSSSNALIIDSLPRVSGLAVETALLSRHVNRHVTWTLKKIFLLATLTEPTVDQAVSTWGPVHSILGLNEYKMTVTKLAEKTYSWKIEGRSRVSASAGTADADGGTTDAGTTDAGWVTLASGESTLGSKRCLGKGTFTIDFDAAAELTTIHEDCGLRPTGVITVKYEFTECEVTPDDDGGTVTPDDGGTVTPDDGGTVTPDDGGTVTPDDGGTVTPDDGGTVTPDDGGTVTPDDGGTVTPDDGGTTCVDPERCPPVRKLASAKSASACHIIIPHHKKRCCITEKKISILYTGMTDPRDDNKVDAFYDYLSNGEGGKLEVVVEEAGAPRHANYKGLHSLWNGNKDGAAVKLVTKLVTDSAGTVATEKKTLTQCWAGHGDHLIFNLVYQLTDPAGWFSKWTDRGAVDACWITPVQPGAVPDALP